jgi:hypothetical protein
MTTLRLYVLITCVWMPIAALDWSTPNEPTPVTLPFPDRCDCLAVEPDLDCVQWAWENCEVMGDSDAYGLELEKMK